MFRSDSLSLLQKLTLMSRLFVLKKIIFKEIFQSDLGVFEK